MPSVDRPPARHDLVWLDDSRWRDALLALPPPEHMDILSSWFARGLPAVVRRQEPGAANALNLGVAQPPARGKLKIPLVIDRATVAKISEPLALDVVAASATYGKQRWLERLAMFARAPGIEFRVFGSLAWQHLSGESYTTSTSDVDLLWRPSDRSQLAAGVALLSRWERDSGIRADGEIILDSDRAVSWREWKQAFEKGQGMVLTKTNSSAMLCSRAELLARLDAESLCTKTRST